MTGVEVIIGNCFPEVGEILPEAKDAIAICFVIPHSKKA